MENIKVEIEVGGINNLDEALAVSLVVFEPMPEDMEKFHNREDWRQKIENDGLLIVGKADGKVVGFIVAYKTADEVLHLWNAGVLQEFRKAGIFSNMFEELAVECRRRGIKKITLNTIEKKFPEMYRYVINKGFMEYEREWVDDPKVGRVEKSKFEMKL